MSLDTSIKSIKLVWQRGGNVHSSWFIPFKTGDVVDALPHASCIVGVELLFNFVFISGGQSTQIKYLSKSTDTYNKILLQ